MKKKSPSQSAFLNLRVLIGLAVFLSGICLALAGLGTFSSPKSVRSQSKNTTPRLGGKSSSTTSFSHAPAARNPEYPPADNDGRFRYMIQFAEKGILQRQTRVPGQRFQANTPQAQTLRTQIMSEQSNHIQSMGRALGH